MIDCDIIEWLKKPRKFKIKISIEFIEEDAEGPDEILIRMKFKKISDFANDFLNKPIYFDTKVSVVRSIPIFELDNELLNTTLDSLYMEGTYKVQEYEKMANYTKWSDSTGVKIA